MRHDLELGYLGIEVPDPATLTPFFRDVIGLVPGEPYAGGPDAGDGGAPDGGGPDGVVTTWRNDGKAHRIVVRPGPANDAAFVGFEAGGDHAFDAATERLRAAGVDVAEGSDDDLRSRRVRRLARADAPFGLPVEIVVGLERATTPFASRLVPGGFLTSGVGFGHIVLATTAFDESCRFLVEGLGLRRSDWLETEIAAGIELEVHFFHCNERHHSVALARTPFELPQRLHHVMVETNERDDVGAAFDRVWATDLAVPNGLGRHDNDGMFSFYVAAPAGFQVEVGHGARRITDGWDDDRRYDRISAWGHQPLRPA